MNRVSNNYVNARPSTLWTSSAACESSQVVCMHLLNECEDKMCYNQATVGYIGVIDSVAYLLKGLFVFSKYTNSMTTHLPNGIT